MRAKDPWNEELKPGNVLSHASTQEAVELGRLLGEVVGLAHRQAILASGRASAAVERITDSLMQLRPTLLTRSSELETYFRREYLALRDDPRVRKLVPEADEYVRKVSSDNR